MCLETGGHDSFLLFSLTLARESRADRLCWEKYDIFYFLKGHLKFNIAAKGIRNDQSVFRAHFIELTFGLTGGCIGNFSSTEEGVV